MFPDLGEAERRVWDAFPDGALTDLTGAQVRDVRAEVIAALLLGAREPEPGRASAVRLCGARISGALDLSGAAVGQPLSAEHCEFTEPVRLVEAATRGIRLRDCFLPALDGTCWRADGIVDLSGTAVRDGICLDHARVDGALTAAGIDLGGGPSGVALSADGLSASGGVRLNALRASGAVRLRGARVDGLIDLTDAVIAGPPSAALALDRIALAGRLRAPGLVVTGRFSLFNADITGSVNMSGAVLRNPGGVALAAGGVTVRGGLWCGDGFRAEGEVRFIGAELQANLHLAGAVLGNPGGVAANLDRAAIGAIEARGVTVTGGPISLTGTRISDHLNLDDARLTSDERDVVLVAEGPRIGGDVLLRRVTAQGRVRFHSCTVGGGVMLDAVRLLGRDGVAFVFSRSDVATDFTANGLTARGTVDLSGTSIGRRLRLDGARISHDGVLLDLHMLSAAELRLPPADPARGTISLGHARIGVLIDDPDHPPAALDLEGLTYESLEPRLPARDRLRWLALDHGEGRSQPYEQLAAHYARAGRPADARRILLARERRQWASAPPVTRLWGRVQDYSVGYGFQPWRAAFWFCLLLLVGGTVFAHWPPAPLKPAEAPHFNPVVYSLDLLVPLVDLGQEHAFNPAGAFQWVSYALIAAGWILVTTIAAGVARTVSRS